MKKSTKINETREKLLDAATQEVYIKGYHGTSTASILQRANVPKGSMYHFFPSKKILVLAVIQERIFPKMDYFFDFSNNEDKTALQVIESIFKKIENHSTLVIYGCPMHRLMVEMSSLDKDFDKILSEHYDKFISNLSNLLQNSIKKQEFISFDTKQFAEFIITSTWGFLSVSPSLSSKENFKQSYIFLLDLLKQKQY